MTLNVFVGFDEREPIAYDVCKYSIETRSSVNVEVFPVKDANLRHYRIHDRPWRRTETGQKIDERDGKPFSTEFSFTRFHTLHLAGLLDIQDWVLFCDCDMLFRDDIANLFDLADDDKAVMCVQHDYQPKETFKMDHQVQTHYVRKNWSSFVLYNPRHPANKLLTVEAVNHEPGSWLHGFGWLRDEDIGALPERWNWLEGWSSDTIDPSNVHFTRGGPWFEGWQRVEYGDLWLQEKAQMLGEANF